MRCVAREAKDAGQWLESDACFVFGFKHLQLPPGLPVLVRLHNDEKGNNEEITVESDENSKSIMSAHVDRENIELRRISIHKQERQCDDCFVSKREHARAMSVLKTEIKRLVKIHSNLTGIDICNVKSLRGGTDIRQRTCIVFYCYLKGLIPIGEPPFPKSIGSIPTDVRESYAFAAGTKDYNNPLGMGCSIGAEGRTNAGSIGPFLTLPGGERGFLTCAHNLFDIDTLLNYADGQLRIPKDTIKVMQPANMDTRSEESYPDADRFCGYVECLRFKKQDERNALDYAVVKTRRERHPVHYMTHPCLSEDERGG